jgi:hypothetical protein
MLRTAVNPRKQRVAKSYLDKLFADSETVWVVHYSCESFYDRVDGRSPRITSIALRKLSSGQTVSFSIHQAAERDGVSLNYIEEHYDALERRMLDEYFTHISSHRGMRYLHWNMRDINYGFAALEHRYKVLGGEPFVVDDKDKFDLSRLFIEIYGVGYVSHPRLENLLKLNSIKPRDFLSGKEEAAAFDSKKFVALHQYHCSG